MGRDDAAANRLINDQGQDIAQRTFISGYKDLTQAQFNSFYRAALDEAINIGDTFLLSTDSGASQMALAYLKAKNVEPRRITIYLATHSMHSMAEKDQRASFESDAYHVVMVEGSVDDRDAAMTDASDSDLLWLKASDKFGPGMSAADVMDASFEGVKENKRRRDEAAIQEAMDFYDTIV